jgi:hypothetical protein
VDIARRLRDLGLPWHPADGDHFAIDVPDLRDQTFMLSAMVIERGLGRHGEFIFKFNGTTEWALDSIEQNEAIWIPREDQLREALGGTFLALRNAGTAHIVDVIVDGKARGIRAPSAEDAYAGALLVLLESGQEQAS